MAKKINNLLIDRVKEATMFNADGSVRWAAQDVSAPKISVTAESKEKLDAMQNVVSKLFQGKKADIDFESAFFSLDLLAAQSGTTVENATSTAKIQGGFREEITIGADEDGAVNKTVELSRTPIGTAGATVKYIYIMNDDKSLGQRYSVATEAGASAFSISGKTITLPTGAELTKDDVVIVYYDAETSVGAKIKNTSNANTDAGLFRMFVIFKDICNEEIKYSGVIEFPSAQISPECELGLEFDSTYSYKLSANKKYCNRGEEVLFNVFVPGDEEGE